MWNVLDDVDGKNVHEANEEDGDIRFVRGGKNVCPAHTIVEISHSHLHSSEEKIRIKDFGDPDCIFLFFIYSNMQARKHST